MSHQGYILFNLGVAPRTATGAEVMYGRIKPCPSGWSVAALGSLVLALSLAGDSGVS